MSRIGISVLSLEQIGQVKPLIERNRQKPYRFLLKDLQGEPLNALLLNEIADLSHEDRGEVFVAVKESEIIGMVVYSDLPWETKVIGNKMGALRYIIVEPDSSQKEEIVGQLLAHIADWAVSRGIEFLLCKTYTDDLTTIHALEKNDFLLMDTLLDYVYDFRRHALRDVPRPSLFQGFTIRLAREDDVNRLATVMQASFRDHFGRFHSDPRISKRKATRVYEEWVKSSWEGYADWILVAEIEGRMAGLSIWKKPSSLEQRQGIKLGHYSIAAVHPDYYGHGLFSALTYAGMELFGGTVDYIEGPTHVNNYPVQWAYTKLLWRICDARHSFHKWLRG